VPVIDSTPSLRAAPPPEDPLFRRFVGGDPEAIEVARRAVNATIAARAYRIAPPERQDIAQDALLDVWRAVTAPGFSFHNSFEGLVRSIACRRCIDARRRKRWTVALDVDVPETRTGAEERLVELEALQLARTVLTRLRDSCQELLRLHTMQSRSYREIAQEQGRSEVALRQQMTDCLKHARVLMTRLKQRAR
jgi:RNA polymerase sigma factor (sigma-70 family)